MKKFLLIFALLILVLFCACGREEVPEKSPASEKVIWKIDGKDYEVFVPAKTRLEDDGEGDITIHTSSLSEGATIDLSGLSGCEYIITFDVVLNTNTEKLVLPNLPNAQNYNILGTEADYIDASAAEGMDNIQILAEAHNVNLGKGPETLYLQYAPDISALAGAENIKSLTIPGGIDLSKIADIGEIEKLYLIGGKTNIGDLENLKSLKRLSVHSDECDFSGSEKLSMEILAIGPYVTQNALDSFSGSESVTELHLNDRGITNAEIIEKCPNLKKLFLTVDVFQDESIVFRTEPVDMEKLSLLKTNIPKEQLEAFLEKGGEIIPVDDWSRT